MKVVQINTTCGVGSTGGICVGISEMLNASQIENHILFSSRTNGYGQGIACSSDRYIRMQALKSRLLGNYGFNSRKETQKIIAELERLRPDIVHLHNIHGHDCHLGMLFHYFKKKKTKLFWTFHDCWTFTGYCTYYTISQCEKWRQGCSHCPQRSTFSWLFDKSDALYQKKKELFSGLDLTIITPSCWLAETVKQSFFGDYPIKVIHNGIDLGVFRPTEGTVREMYHIPPHRHIVLGVSLEWGYRKGLDVFLQLAERLDPEAYQIVLVGTNDEIDKRLPKQIISIHRTESRQALAELYTAASVYVNPTRDEVLGLVNIESIACGTPVITFNSGGSPECVDETCGVVVDCDDVDTMLAEILRICETKPFGETACMMYAKHFDKEKKFGEYISLYKEIGCE